MMSFAVMAIVKATLVCGLAFLLSSLLRHARASIRHLIFALAFTALAVIPGVTLVLPTVAITVPAALTAKLNRAQDTAPALPMSLAAGRPAGTSSSAGREATLKDTVTFGQVVTTTWLIGVVLFLMPVTAGLWQLRYLRKSAWPWHDGQSLVETMTSSACVRRRIDVLLHDAVTGPLTCGVFRASIILPAGAREWDEVSLRCALRHELEHIARWDFSTLCVSRLIGAAYWFHPLVWAMRRQLRLEAERACDDAVLREEDARDYAYLLVSMAQQQPAGTPRPVLAMAGRDDLSARVAAVLNDRQPRGHVGRRVAVGSVVTAAMVVSAISPVTVVRAMPQTQQTATSASGLRFETISLKRNRDNERSWWRIGDNEDGTAGVGPDGRVQWLTATNVTARLLLSSAFSFELRGDRGIGGPHQIDNAPEWIDSDRFDVVARAPSRATKEQMNQMMQSLLAERFSLEVHLASKEFPIHALALSRSDGNPGPRMTPSHIDCTSKPGASSPCGLSSSAGRLTGRGVTMAQLVRILPNHLGGAHRIGLDRRVLDHTGLSGPFDFTLEWTQDSVSPAIFVSAPWSFPLESKAPNFVAALQDQLGLMFETQWAPQPVLAIDRIAPPAEN